MRIYEISKQYGISNKELVDFLSSQGFSVQSHMAVFPPEALALVQNRYASKSSQPETVATKSEKVAPIAESKKESSMQIQKPSSASQAQSPVSSSKPSLNSAHPAFRRLAPGEKGDDKKQDGIVIKPMTVAQAAECMAKPVSELIVTLLKQGQMSNKNQLLSEKVVEQLAHYYQVKIIKPVQQQQSLEKSQAATSTHATERLPVVVVMGHVDHGKTTLLDFIRKTKVAEKEKGGITQHLGAYQVTLPLGGMVFLDTPGHAAFSKIRGRGVKVADIAVLVVAADDGVMPQTIEAIKQARSLQVPIIVALNKIDKATPIQIEAAKRGLAQQDLLPEEWGGETIVAPISAKNGEGVDHLLEMIALQSQMMDLKADLQKPARGFVLEAKVEKGLGSVATVICYEGVLRMGDFFVAGATQGKVTSLVNSQGQRLKEAVPSMPVQISGFDDLPHAGDDFDVIDAASYKAVRHTTAERSTAAQKKIIPENTIAILLKADTHSSKEALIGSIEKLSERVPKAFYIVQAGIGDINESDIIFAAETNATIYGFHVKLEHNAAQLAQQKKVDIQLFNIIYKLLDYLEGLSQQAKAVKLVATKIGQAVVRKVFDIKNIGVIAGSYIKEGRFAREGHVIILRGKRKVGEGKIKSLERDRKSVKEVHTGFECAFLIDGFNEWQVDDTVDCYIDIPE